MRADGERDEEPQRHAGASPRQRATPRERPLDEALDPERPQDRHDQQQQMPQAVHVVQVHVAVRKRQHEMPEPPRAHQEVQCEQVRGDADGRESHRQEPA